MAPRSSFLALWLLLFLAPVVASEQTPGDRDLIRERQERLLQQQQQRLEELRQLPAEAAQLPVEAVEAEGRCFEIQTLSLTGASLLSEADQTAIFQPFAGQCLGVGQLNQLLKVITNHYIARGYVTTRAYLPQQDLADGELDVIVVEGQLEGLDSSALASERELAMSFPGQAGSVLNLRELEQLVEQLNRLPSRQAQN